MFLKICENGSLLQTSSSFKFFFVLRSSDEIEADRSSLFVTKDFQFQHELRIVFFFIFHTRSGL
jgi:hypothetical protein